LLDDGLSPIANTEEVAWCYRARKAGWKVAYCPDAVITHIGGQSMEFTLDEPDRMRVEMYRTRLAFFRKHYGLASAVMLSWLYRATLPWNMLMLTQSVLRGTIPRRQQRAHMQTLKQIARLRVPGLKWMDPNA
jgi:GT2 family glycosyltransferase